MAKIFPFDKRAAQAALVVREREQRREAKRLETERARAQEQAIWDQLFAERAAQPQAPKPVKARHNHDTREERHRLVTLMEKLLDESLARHKEAMKNHGAVIFNGRYAMEWHRFVAFARVYGQVFESDPRMLPAMVRAKRLYGEWIEKEHSDLKVLSDLRRGTLPAESYQDLAVLLVGLNVTRAEVRKAARKELKKAAPELRALVLDRIKVIRKTVREHRKLWAKEGRHVPSVFQLEDMGILIGHRRKPAKANVNVVTFDERKDD
jgi:hypothetical protein